MLSLVIGLPGYPPARPRPPGAHPGRAGGGCAVFTGIVIYWSCAARTLEGSTSIAEEEALLQSLEESSLCPAVAGVLKESWTVCPNCTPSCASPATNAVS